MLNSSRRLTLLVGLVGLTIVCPSLSRTQAAERPNIILLMGDDHGWDETGYNGHPHLKTPVLDQMAASGLRLDRFYSAHPSCSPTRGSVMTGRHPNRYGTFSPGYSIRPEEITIAHLLSEAGYMCGHFGKWHLGPVKAASPTNPGAMGFDQWLSHDNFFELDPWLSRNGGAPEQYPGESSQIVIEHTIEFLKTAQREDKPYLAVVWFGSPHEPYSGLPEDLALYDNLPAEYGEQQVRLTSNETGRPTQRPRREVLRERYAEITAMDRAIGELRQWLGDNRLRDNTLLWYCGDNGTSGDGIVTSPLRGQKGNHYEGGVRVPGIIEWPAKLPQPQTSALNSVTSDILPTLCDLVDIQLPNRPLDGVSLQPLIDGEMAGRPKPICFWTFESKGAQFAGPYIAAELQKGTTPLVKMQGNLYTRNFQNQRYAQVTEQDLGGTRVILDDRYKLIISGAADSQQRELYDLRQDPFETNDLGQLEADRVQQMASELRRWQQSVLESLTGADY